MTHIFEELGEQGYAMRSIGQEVSYDSMKAGDIICYSGHVALYMSNGCLRATIFLNETSYLLL